MAFNDLMIMALCFWALFQRAPHRFYISVLFSFSFGMHSIFSINLSDFNYYLSDAIIGVIVLAFIAVFANPSRFAELILCACIAIIGGDFVGWFYLYESGLSPAIYNIFFSAIHLLVFYAMLKGDNKDEPLYISRLRFVRVFNWQSARVHNSLHKKAETA